MDKVYVVWYDNGEPYDDNFQDIKAIFKTVEEAKEFIKNEGYTREVPYEFHIDVGNYQVVGDVYYRLSEEDESYYYRPSLDIREYSLQH